MCVCAVLCTNSGGTQCTPPLYTGNTDIHTQSLFSFHLASLLVGNSIIMLVLLLLCRQRQGRSTKLCLMMMNLLDLIFPQGKYDTLVLQDDILSGHTHFLE